MVAVVIVVFTPKSTSCGSIEANRFVGFVRESGGFCGPNSDTRPSKSLEKSLNLELRALKVWLEEQ